MTRSDKSETRSDRCLFQVTVVAQGDAEWAVVERVQTAFPAFGFLRAEPGLLGAKGGVWVLFPKKRRWSLTRWTPAEKDNFRMWSALWLVLYD